MIDSFLFQYSNTFLLNDANPDNVLVGHRFHSRFAAFCCLNEYFQENENGHNMLYLQISLSVFHMQNER